MIRIPRIRQSAGAGPVRFCYGTLCHMCSRYGHLGQHVIPLLNVGSPIMIVSNKPSAHLGIQYHLTRRETSTMDSGG